MVARPVPADGEGPLRWADLPLCECGLRHWPEEVADRHRFSLLTDGFDTAALWLSGDAPDDVTQRRSHTEAAVALGVRHVVDVRAEAWARSQWDRDVLAGRQITYRILGVVDHHDAFADAAATLAWVETLEALPVEPLLVHCHVGVNRSASAAVILLVSRGIAVADAFRAVLDRRPSAMAIYAPAAIEHRWGSQAGAEARTALLRLRGSDRRYQDSW